MSNKLCLYERGRFTEPENCSVWLKISISNNSPQYSFVIGSVGFNIDRITTQHTPTCVENCSDIKVSYNSLSNFHQIFCNLGYNSENRVFFTSRLIILLWTGTYQNVTVSAHGKQQKLFVKLMRFKNS